MSDDHGVFEYLRKEGLDIYNRLHSIEEDIHFVNQVVEVYSGIPALPNLRCGAWYIHPEHWQSKSAAYFKSTDGHFGNWSFNLRRPNLHLLPILSEHNGLVLIDSTRAGKRIPDSFSKTVPIWCAVVNRALVLRYPGLKEDDWNTELYTPPSVSQQEHHQIQSRLDSWASSLANSTYTLPNLPYPLRPLWITPSTRVFPELSGGFKFIPLICVSASKVSSDDLDLGRSGGYTYVQGSGDDHELWGNGLTPELFWKNKEVLLGSQRGQLERVVQSLVGKASLNSEGIPPLRKDVTLIKAVRGTIGLCAVSDLSKEVLLGNEDVAYVLLGEDQDVRFLSLAEEEEKRILHLPVPEGKRGHDQYLQQVLPQADRFISKVITEGMKVCVACHTGNDLSAGVVLVALQRHFTDEGERNTTTSVVQITKQSIRKRLEWIISSRPETNPSRSTLKRVNEFLLSGTFRPQVV